MRCRSLAWALLLLTGCAREARPVATAAPIEGNGSPWTATGYAWPPKVRETGRVGFLPAAQSDQMPAGQSAATLPSGSTASRNPSMDLQSGDVCLRHLRRLGVTFRPQADTLGVDTPVVVSGAIGGIRYYANGDLPLLCDCRLALALHRIASVLRDSGVRAARFSGAYSYRKTRSGRLSLHARGLAIDLHEFVVAGRTLSVERDYARGLSRGCASTAPVLNRLACRLHATGLFRELLTPDYDRDHRDHFHLGISPLREEPKSPARLVVAQ